MCRQGLIAIDNRRKTSMAAQEQKMTIFRAQECYTTDMEHIFIDTSAITQDALGYLRDKNTDIRLFRYYADRIAFTLMHVALAQKDLVAKNTETPVGFIDVQKLQGKFVFVTILRAGLAMLPAALQIIPTAPVGFLGLKRDETTAIAKEYYRNLPKIDAETTVILADPMLATGGSMMHTLEQIAAFSPKEIRVVTVICAPEGIAKIQEKFPYIRIVTAAVDEKLNDKKYIVPGLGDFGDRYFGTQ